MLSQCPGLLLRVLTAAPAQQALLSQLAAAAPAAAQQHWDCRVLSHSFASSSSSTPDASTVQWQQQQQQAANLQPRRDLVDKLLSVDNMSRAERLQQRKDSIVQEYQRLPGDTGSPEVQVALLTEKIRDMAEHVLTHKKDHVAKRGLQGMLNQRRALLSYLRRDNFPRYAFVLHKLGLKDTYAKQARYDRYRVGTRLGTPAEPLKRYGSH